jgi:hypothetical protein
MIPLALGALGAVGSLSQMYTAYRQNRAANKMNPVRPEYQIPGALQESVGMARQSANGMMPGMGVAQNNLMAGTANANRAAQLAGNGNNALATIAAAQGNEGNAMNNLAAQNAQYNVGQRQNLQGQLGALSQQQTAQWDWNHKQKFQEESAARAALKGASLQNMHSGLKGLSNLGMAYLGGQNPNAEVTPLKQTTGIPGFNMPTGLQSSQMGQYDYRDPNARYGNNMG